MEAIFSSEMSVYPGSTQCHISEDDVLQRMTKAVDVEEIEWEGVDWNHLAQDRDLCERSCVHGNEPFRFHKRRELIDYKSDCQLVKKELFGQCKETIVACLHLYRGFHC
jgi:hypothetical protein